jgi:putative cell wall-binding protein
MTEAAVKDQPRLGRLLGGLIVLVISSVIPISVADGAATVARIAGADRFATAAALSAAGYSPGVNAVFVATGDAFPDALAVAPIAGPYYAPVLLTHATSLPSSTAQELDRLRPLKILVVGGPSAISDNVVAALAQHTSGSVQRIQGPDRYATAAALSSVTFAPGVMRVVIASGADFPDALSAGAMAAKVGGPVLLVPNDGALPASVANELQRLQPQIIIIVGGPKAISPTVLSQVQNYGSMTVDRGVDRFATSAEVSKRNFPSSSKVFLVTGRDYPDGLAAGAPAGFNKAPVLLVDTTCIPAVVNQEINRLGAQTIIIVGGSAAISEAVASRTVCG